MNNTFKILTDKHLIVETLSGDINPKDYSKLKIEEFRHKLFNRNYNLVTDLTGFRANENNDLIQDIIGILMENKGKVSRKKNAIVYKDISLLSKILKRSGSNSQIKIFTTQNEAINWAER